MIDSWPTAPRTALQRGQLIVAEVPASRPDRRAWIAIYPLQSPAATGHGFNLFHREFETSYIQNGWCVGPGDGMTDVRTAHAQDEMTLNQVLTTWGLDPSQLTYAHRTDYPV
ncbi:hypothetical protein [Micromonospora chersina]|uniref:Uncharacterized protein n=1 Tax=Micromonospora chersina TaxID=47854 RepID=A0A1C6UAT3_9ACTN|nr:hypothetical protein [Micromonospora chersina]SCL51021.1 hypothetical protein GA0070603_1113 [Micromonospora chersina]